MTEPPKQRRLTPKGQATRNRILDAAISLIGRQGVAGTSIEDVRAAAGVSGSQLYHYFDSKHELVKAVITRQADTVVRPGLTSRSGVASLDSLDALRAWADAAIDRLEENGCRAECDLGSLAAELSATDERARTDLADGFLRWKDVILGGLRAMRGRGELREDADLDELALALLGALQGGTLLSHTVLQVQPLRASMNAALAYVRTFATGAPGDTVRR